MTCCRHTADDHSRIWRRRHRLNERHEAAA